MGRVKKGIFPLTLNFEKGIENVRINGWYNLQKRARRKMIVSKNLLPLFFQYLFSNFIFPKNNLSYRNQKYLVRHIN